MTDDTGRASVSELRKWLKEERAKVAALEADCQRHGRIIVTLEAEAETWRTVHRRQLQRAEAAETENARLRDAIERHSMYCGICGPNSAHFAIDVLPPPPAPATPGGGTSPSGVSPSPPRCVHGCNHRELTNMMRENLPSGTCRDYCLRCRKPAPVAAKRCYHGRTREEGCDDCNWRGELDPDPEHRGEDQG